MATVNLVNILLVCIGNVNKTQIFFIILDYIDVSRSSTHIICNYSYSGGYLKAWLLTDKL